MVPSSQRCACGCGVASAGVAALPDHLCGAGGGQHSECKASLIAGRLERFLTSSFRRSGGVRSSSECLGPSVAAVLMRSHSAKASGSSSAGRTPKGLPPRPPARHGSTRPRPPRRHWRDEQQFGSRPPRTRQSHRWGSPTTMPRRSLEGPKKAPDLVPRNSRGGVLVTDEELKSAFEFFDVEGSGKITQVRSRRPVVWRCLHAIDATRLHQRRRWVVFF